jgi:phenylacetate-coenzyme A ligase PaaK-like adenylate-forming protein
MPKTIAKNNCLERFVTPRESWNPVEKALFTHSFFSDDYENVQELMVPAVKYSFNHHYNNNVIYHKICEINGITPESIKSKDDFNKIPLLPDTFFKDYPEDEGFLNWLKTIFTGSIPNIDFKTGSPSIDEVIKKFNETGIFIMFTSGTSGRFSFIPRDNCFLESREI